MRSNSYRPSNAVNTGSMADIAFLLLIFFLVATTIAKDKGIEVILPPHYDGLPGKMADRNVLDILVNADNELLIEGKPSSSLHLLDDVKYFITNPDGDQSLPASPTTAIISIRHHPHTSYQAYTDIYSIIKQAYIDLRDEQSLSLYGQSFAMITPDQRNNIRALLPLKISDAEVNLQN